MRSASKDMFLANAEEKAFFECLIGLSCYRVNLPHYTYGENHYVAKLDVEKYIEPVLNALKDNDLFEKEGFLYKESLPRGDCLNAVVQGCRHIAMLYNLKNINDEPHVKFKGGSLPSEARGVWPVVEILAAAADSLQLNEMTEVERDYWAPIVLSCVENELGVFDALNLTDRARKHGYSGSKLNIPGYQDPPAELAQAQGSTEINSNLDQKKDGLHFK